MLGPAAHLFTARPACLRRTCSCLQAIGTVSPCGNFPFRGGQGKGRGERASRGHHDTASAHPPPTLFYGAQGHCISTPGDFRSVLIVGVFLQAPAPGVTGRRENFRFRAASTRDDYCAVARYCRAVVSRGTNHDAAAR